MINDLRSLKRFLSGTGYDLVPDGGSHMNVVSRETGCVVTGISKHSSDYRAWKNFLCQIESGTGLELPKKKQRKKADR